MMSKDERYEEALDIIEEDAAEIGDLKAEIKRLRAIVNMLPKTADGVPVTPGMVLWYKSPAGIVPTEPLPDWSEVASCLEQEWGSPFYSTQAAAEAGGGDKC